MDLISGWWNPAPRQNPVSDSILIGGTVAVVGVVGVLVVQKVRGSAAAPVVLPSLPQPRTATAAPHVTTRAASIARQSVARTTTATPAPVPARTTAVPAPVPASAQAPVPTLSASDHAFIRGLQDHLRELGYRLDSTGNWDQKTSETVASFQSSHGLPATGRLNGATATRLRSVFEQHIQATARSAEEARQRELDEIMFWSSIISLSALLLA